MDEATPPAVSAIVPSYNHARFLPQRLGSILEQTYRDLEVLVCDDASSDETPEVLRAFADDPRVRIFFESRNSGSGFIQWNRGAARARGRYLWFAESDDYADPHFLEVLVPVLDAHPRVGLVHCQSWMVDDRGAVLRAPEAWWDEVDPARWRRDFVCPGRDELRYLGHWNVISNASAVLLRRDLFRELGGADESMRLGADWLLWIKMLLAADVGFVAQPLSFWRWHANTVRERSLRNGVEDREVARVLRFYAEQTGASPRAVETRYHLRKAVSAIRWRNGREARRHALASLRAIVGR